MKRKLSLLKKRLFVIINDKNRKNLLTILKESLRFWILKKEIPYFYFGKFLYRKEITNYKDYLSSKEVDKITLSKKLHKFQYSSLLRNKLSFALYMEENNLPVPKSISFNYKNRFYYNSTLLLVNSEEELLLFIQMILRETNTTSVFIKSITGMGGYGCFLLTKKNLAQEIKQYAKEILSHEFIHQEVIEQHTEINKIYKRSVNTIRFDTYIDKKGVTHILSAFMRFGSGGDFIDNGSAGGIYLSVDLEKGKLIGKSHQLMKYGGKQLEKHPNTHTTFDGFEIPYFEESKLLIKKAVSYIPDRIIGWDIAISNNGPIIIEGNDNNSFITPDIAYGGYLKHPIFKEILEEA
ncbi:sugar-transfer associated ATP-grasp domain-containing protein [uncultured Aquimarina sp.]|uniref:sugar-transfer associated ATP-grasp domain-containing protein n=1 Tax=uncultured Aquimarina sp. TaxID=575652 RepID=UPI00262314E4|nr:sugar-transfer associated ATP-grasp domain-containing protein [uncultured Aquimarina sp.]